MGFTMEEVKISLDFQGDLPIYVQIMNGIKRLIARGLLQPGDQLPTLRQLASDLDVNFSTVARAYHLLDEEGIISTQHGRGTYILPLAGPNVQTAKENLALEDLTFRYLENAAQLGYSVEEVQAALKRALQERQAYQETHREPREPG